MLCLIARLTQIERIALLGARKPLPPLEDLHPLARKIEGRLRCPPKRGGTLRMIEELLGKLYAPRSQTPGGGRPPRAHRCLGKPVEGLI